LGIGRIRIRNDLFRIQIRIRIHNTVSNKIKPSLKSQQKSGAAYVAQSTHKFSKIEILVELVRTEKSLHLIDL
jgi:hypothetical protein